MYDYDYVLVGARCAGAATALQLARGGARVLVLDRTRLGTDALSTHAIMRGGVIQLARWGLLDAVRSTTPVIRETTFQYDDERIAVPIKPDAWTDGLYAPRRTVLDPLLARAAAEAGAEVVFEAAVRELLRGPDGRVRGVRFSRRGRGRRQVTARAVIGADGLRSFVARSVDARVLMRGSRMSGVVYGYFRGTGIDANAWYFREGSSAGAIPTNDGLTCVFVAVSSDAFQRRFSDGIGAGFAQTLAGLDRELAERIAASESAGPLRAFRGATGHLRQATGPGWALVGDAGYFRDPITAHGITDALRDAESLSRALLADHPEALAAYATQRDRASVEMLQISDRIAAYDWSIDEVKELHMALSRNMKTEAQALGARPVRGAEVSTKSSAPSTAATWARMQTSSSTRGLSG